MENYHLQFDDEDVKNGLLNVDPDGCLKPAKKVIFNETLDDGTILFCGRPANEMTQDEAYGLCMKHFEAHTLWADSEHPITAICHGGTRGLAASYVNMTSGSTGFPIADGHCYISMSAFKSNEV